MENTPLLSVSSSGAGFGFGANHEGVTDVGGHDEQGEPLPCPCTCHESSAHAPLSYVHQDDPSRMSLAAKQCYTVFIVVGLLLLLTGITLACCFAAGPIATNVILLGVAMLLYGGINLLAGICEARLTAVEENPEPFHHRVLLPYPAP